MTRVVTSRAADVDIARAVEHYRDQADVETVSRFIDALEQATRRLATFPGSGSATAEVRTGIPGLRAIGAEGFPFLLFYTCDDDAVRVHRVLHERRDIDTEFRPWI
ncbi:type II toxin-antitoxin system RelE/ParE family toxin [uncultured Microbacterium sp.]|uniref:type II toxin-antitoxin system RelE/ParE family toxin n=1 Tax=uncultured Microbacterium sp. TaxID=191216 RepID=UPI002617147E|nr:type II toxin-antitoxin system RelE/ParE family toxin [uncultured Microbacterium sp.]